MNYKKIFKSQQLRFTILRVLSFIPDSLMLRMQYFIKIGFLPNFKDPKRFTEKIQVYKMKYRNELMFTCVDKYNVRGYIEQKGLSETLNILYGVYEDPEKIEFDKLPDQFVIKTTDGSGGENVLICRDKASLNWTEAISDMKTWKNKKSVNAGREWAYTGVQKSQYIVERYLENDIDKNDSIRDYKFFCFSGKVFCIAVDADRYLGHKRNFYDPMWNKIEASNYPNFDDDSGVPVGFEEMKRVAEILSADFPFVRVDLYNVGGKVYFGELTYYPVSGYGVFTPDSFDFTLGEQFDISSFHNLK